MEPTSPAPVWRTHYASNCTAYTYTVGGALRGRIYVEGEEIRACALSASAYSAINAEWVNFYLVMEAQRWVEEMVAVLS